MAKERKSSTAALRCPTCDTLVLPHDPNVPFCSDRCRVVDLGKWASDAYRISSPVLDPEVLEGLDEMQRSGRTPDDDE
jgi:uncharacterized protein